MVQGKGTVSVTVDSFGKIDHFKPTPGALYAICTQDNESRSLENSIAIAEELGCRWAVVSLSIMDRSDSIRNKVNEAVLSGFKGVVIVVVAPDTYGGRYDDSEVVCCLLHAIEELSATSPVKFLSISNAKLLKTMRLLNVPIIRDCQLDDPTKTSIPDEVFSSWAEGLELSELTSTVDENTAVKQKGGK